MTDHYEIDVLDPVFNQVVGVVVAAFRLSSDDAATLVLVRAEELGLDPAAFASCVVSEPTRAHELFGVCG